MKSMTLKIVLDTVYKIIKSRFTKPNETKESLRKKSICKKCEFNSLNVEKVTLNKTILKWWSDLYSKITGNSEKDVLGNCFGCKSCSVYYKILVGDKCPKEKW